MNKFALTRNSTMMIRLRDYYYAKKAQLDSMPQ